VNTRGHDALSGVTTGRARRRQGAAAEIVDECRLDLQAWVAFANEQGFRRVVPVGHSLGAVKVIYALANHPPLAAARAIAVSPPCLSYAKFMDSPRREEFLANLARAEAAIANGRPEELLEVQFPIPMLISASSYVDKYGPQERYNILRYLKHVACPLVITFGGLELQDGPAFAGLPEAIAGLGLSGMVQTAIVPGANHFYAGSVEPLARQIVDWLADEPRKP
jgi:pimeloyl-ACP methyl ester carboxylesterase